MYTIDAALISPKHSDRSFSHSRPTLSGALHFLADLILFKLSLHASDAQLTITIYDSASPEPIAQATC